MLEFVEGTLPPTLNAAVARHIEGCPSCMKELEGQSSRTHALRRLGRVSAPDQWPEISRSIRRAGWRYFLRRYGLPAAIFGATAAIVMTAFSTLMPDSRRAAEIRPGGLDREVADGDPATAAVTTGTQAARRPEAVSDAAAKADTETPAAATAVQYDALEADHYGETAGEILGDGASLLAGGAGK